MTTSERARRVIDFDHHSADLTAEVSDLGVGAALSPLRQRCPIGWTQSHGGYWVATGYDEIQKISRNDDVFSRKFRLPTRDYVIEMRFDPADPPSYCHQVATPADDLGAATRRDMVVDSSGHTHAVAIGFGPGAFAVAWGWAD